MRHYLTIAREIGWDEQPSWWHPVKRRKWWRRQKTIAYLEVAVGIVGDLPYPFSWDDTWASVY